MASMASLYSNQLSFGDFSFNNGDADFIGTRESISDGIVGAGM
jgi:hypothetical protein